MNSELVPRKTDTAKPVKKNVWTTRSKVRNPVLAWDFKILDGGNYAGWVKSIDPETITWDLEIYDRRMPVYTAKQIRGMSHAMSTQLEACESYYWTVRPNYPVDGVVKNGEWMRLVPVGESGNGNVGRAASEAHAYIQDFATLEIDCRAR